MRVRHFRCVAFFAAALLAAAPPPASADAESAPAAEESCVRCHADPDFVSTHPRLYEYYRDWERSIHGQEGVTCFDCHGGDPDAQEARRAHAEFAEASGRPDAVSFTRVHETCGVCHDEVLEAYTRSEHYRQLKEGRKGERHGPTCVTCHSAMNTLTLDVTTVEQACARCHNQETGIDPAIPERARATLNKFLSIDRFHRYIAARMDPAESGRFFRSIDERVAALSVRWHTFELEKIRAETQEVLDAMRAKRDEIRGDRPAGGSGASPPHEASEER